MGGTKQGQVDSEKFIVTLKKGSVQLVPIPKPEDLKGSIEIPWSIRDLEEAGEKFVEKRAGE